MYVKISIHFFFAIGLAGNNEKRYLSNCGTFSSSCSTISFKVLIPLFYLGLLNSNWSIRYKLTKEYNSEHLSLKSDVYLDVY